MFGLEHERRATLSDMLQEAVACHRAANEFVWRHEGEEGTRRGQDRQAVAGSALDPALAQGIPFARTADPEFPPAPEGGLVLRSRLSLLLLLTACSSWQRMGKDSAPTPEESLTSLIDMPAVYRSMGRIAAGPPLPFVGTMVFAAGPGDSVKAILGLSIEKRALAFRKDGTSYLARYRVEMYLESPDAPPIRFARDQEVRVVEFSETMRNDESVLFQQLFHLKSGSYHVTVSVRDPVSARQTQADADFVAPDFSAASFSAPILAYQVTGRGTREQDLAVVLSPRGTVSYGGDTLLALVEGYNYATPTAVPFDIINDLDQVITQDTLRFTGARPIESHVIRIVPDSQPLGELRIRVGSGAETRQASVLVSFSGAWILTNYSEMLDLLRYFGHEDLLKQLKKAPASERARLWQEFYKKTDPVPVTPENEALEQYFGRMSIANQRFTDEEVPGWRTDRGMVFITLGEPEEIFNSSSSTQGRFFRWTYVPLRLEVVFEDVASVSRFRLTSDSRAAYDRVLARVRRGES
jgi:GWxTD domain-containing protein